MSPLIKDTGSLRRRLIFQLLISVAILSVVLYFTVRLIAEGAAESTQDNILGASVVSIVDQVRVKDDQIAIDIPYSSLSMLGSVSDDRVFYRISVDDQTLTGYDDLPRFDATTSETALTYWTEDFRGSEIRLATQIRPIFYGGRTHLVAVTVAQTRNGQELITSRIANTAAAVGIGFFVIAGALSWFAASSALRPLRRVEQSVQRRGPLDLRPMTTDAPREIVPLLSALNSFMDRLSTALGRTEDFIAEAAHRVRTPLSTVRANAEIALLGTKDAEQRKTLRTMIRAVDESSRSAGQLLDHVMISFRSDQIELAPLEFADVISQVVTDLSPTSELRDIAINWQTAINPKIRGDKILLIGAIRNLLDNAIKYSPRDCEIHITLTQDQNSCCARICDVGRGLGDADEVTLKKRFERGANATDVVGSGLGLTIAEDVARVHGGTLTLRPNKGQGTCVSFSLPRLS
ncbi:MAG: sensor histidine kinase N-terminal domain-containing protein [Paracoccaceae bacterium]